MTQGQQVQYHLLPVFTLQKRAFYFNVSYISALVNEFDVGKEPEDEMLRG